MQGIAIIVTFNKLQYAFGKHATSCGLIGQYDVEDLIFLVTS